MSNNKLPPEPIPGQYYKNRDGIKVLYIGKGRHNVYYYENQSGDIALPFERPYHYHKNCNHNYDIVAPWTEPTVRETLPAIEIKRWAVVEKDGEVISIHGCPGYALSRIPEHERFVTKFVVELTGTLPAREV